MRYQSSQSDWRGWADRNLVCPASNRHHWLAKSAWALIAGSADDASDEEIAAWLRSRLTRREKPAGECLEAVTSARQKLRQGVVPRSAKPKPEAIPIPVTAMKQGTRREVWRERMHWAEQATLVIRECFREDEWVCIHPMMSASGSPSTGLCLPRDEWIKRIKEVIKPNTLGGVYIRINPTRGQCDDDVTAYRYVLVEGDTMHPQRQLEILTTCGLPIKMICSSGGKSIHAWVDVGAATLDEYEIRRERVWRTLNDVGFPVDRNNGNPGRYSRLAGAYRGRGRKQELYFIGNGDGEIDWSVAPEPQKSPTEAVVAEPVSVDHADCKVATNANFDEVIAEVTGATEVALDIETYGKTDHDHALDPRRGNIRIIAIACDAGVPCYIDLHRVDLSKVRELLNILTDKRLLIHNARFDLAFLREHFGFRANGLVADTKVMAGVPHNGLVAGSKFNDKPFAGNSLGPLLKKELGLDLSRRWEPEKTGARIPCSRMGGLPTPAMTFAIYPLCETHCSPRLRGTDCSRPTIWRRRCYLL